MSNLLRIGLPLTADLTCAVLDLVAARWPDSTIRTDTGDTGHMVIDLGDTVNLNPDVPVPDSRDRQPDELDVNLARIDTNGLGMGLPAVIGRAFIDAFATMFDDNPAAENYIEIQLGDPATGDRQWTVIVCRPDGTTPHEKRLEAEAELARWKAAALAAGINPDTV